MTTTAVLPIASCGRCGAAFRARLAKCGTCGAPDIPVLPEVVTTDGTVPALSGAAPVERGAQRGALAIDLLPVVLVLVAAIVVAGAAASTSALVLGVLAAALTAGLHAAMLTSRGRSLGRLLLRQRTVDDLTGLLLPPRSSRSGSCSGGAWAPRPLTCGAGGTRSSRPRHPSVPVRCAARSTAEPPQLLPLHRRSASSTRPRSRSCSTADSDS